MRDCLPALGAEVAVSLKYCRQFRLAIITMEFKDLQLLALDWVFLCHDFFICVKNGCCQFRMLPRCAYYSEPYSYGCVCEASLHSGQECMPDQAKMVLQRVLVCELFVIKIIVYGFA